MPKAARQPSLPSSRQLPYPTLPPTPKTYQPRSPPMTEDRHASTSWSAENDEVLLQARLQGLNWQPIASQYFPGKTANACRKRYERLIEKRNAADSWDVAKIAVLARTYGEIREQMWSILADRMGEKWTAVEAKCMEKGLKALQSVARAESRQERKGSLQPSAAEMAGHSFMRHVHRSRSHSRDSDAFNDSAIGHEPTNSPFATSSRAGYEDDHHGHYPSSAHTSSSSRFPTPSRTFSTSSSSFPGFTPTLASTSPSFPFSASPTATIQPPMAISHGHQPSQTLPSLKDSLKELSFPSLIASSLPPRHHSPKMPSSMQAPVTTH